MNHGLYGQRSIQAQRPLVPNVLFLDRAQTVPKCKTLPDHKSNHQTDQKEPTVSGEGDQEKSHDSERDDKTGRPLQPEALPAGIGCHDRYSSTGRR